MTNRDEVIGKPSKPLGLPKFDIQVGIITKKTLISLVVSHFSSIFLLVVNLEIDSITA